MNSIPAPPPIGGSSEPTDEQRLTGVPEVPLPPRINDPVPSSQGAQQSPPASPKAEKSFDRESGAPTAHKRPILGIISLILGILGILLVTAVAGVVLGILAIRESKRNQGRGEALAIVALVINGAWLLLYAVIIFAGD